MSGTCTAATPLSRDHLAPAIAAAGVTIAPAHHGAPSRADERGTMTATADLLIVGRIATGDSAAPRAEAMAVRDGRILAVGSAADVDGLTGPETKILSPDGVVIPGLIEPHAHIWVSLLTLEWTDISHAACPRFDDVVSVLTAAAQATPAGQYVLAKLFDRRTDDRHGGHRVGGQRRRVGPDRSSLAGGAGVCMTAVRRHDSRCGGCGGYSRRRTSRWPSVHVTVVSR